VSGSTVRRAEQSGSAKDWLVITGPLLALFVLGVAAQSRSGAEALTVLAFAGALAGFGALACWTARPPPGEGRGGRGGLSHRASPKGWAACARASPVEPGAEAVREGLGAGGAVTARHW
jgi:hypothetical protein